MNESKAGLGGTLKPRKHEQRLLRNMGVHKASNNQGAWEIRDDGDVDPGGVGPAADPLRPEGGREDERADAARPPVPSELLSFKPKQPGLVQSECSWMPFSNL